MLAQTIAGRKDSGKLPQSSHRCMAKNIAVRLKLVEDFWWPLRLCYLQVQACTLSLACISCMVLTLEVNHDL